MYLKHYMTNVTESFADKVSYTRTQFPSKLILIKIFLRLASDKLNFLSASKCCCLSLYRGNIAQQS